MEKSVSPLPDPKTVSPPPSKSPPLASPPPSDHLHTQHFASSFTTLYHSIFPPKPSPLPSSLAFSLTPSTASPSSAATTDDFDTEHRLHQARLILEYQELCDHYELSLSRLQAFTEEIELLRQENADLRLTNNELVRLLSLSSQAAIQSRFSSCEMVEPNRFERNTERVLLPKSISVRSSGYLKMNRDGASNGGQSSTSTRPRVPNHLDKIVSGSVQHRVCVPGGVKREDAALELDVYNQGMQKTELCNKWQETGTCSYGDHCQFAHGITELRPVIRHPRYKTQVCRMVLAGEVCPYGHRCHFRHSLTEQERMIMGPR
ncbi:hypothetical protein P3X46_016212 [Hevea brasiliensis]|uniref:C3H1-type domain-containing protein n=1 Tax=Hevea brasiliensis TaxID=3981 RepID=A0ABQ9LYJ4_HEVBR|nr:zinc finger CCCH domain-containing protein 14-like [Hevea brasiliensis]KAJ9173036.1 hypothetical protein P3X46_016212 [Hevea brasiliensis]